MDNRLAKASSSFGRLQKRVRQNHSLRLSTKLQVYRAVVVTTLLYGSESWVLYRKQIQLLEQFQRSIMGIHWQDYVTNNEVLEQASLPSVEAMLMLRQLRWAGHVSRMDDTRIPKAVFYGELRQGRRDRGAPRRRYKDQLKRQLILVNIDHKGWEQPAADRNNWRAPFRRAVEEKRRRKLGNNLHSRQIQAKSSFAQIAPEPANPA